MSKPPLGDEEDDLTPGNRLEDRSNPAEDVDPPGGSRWAALPRGLEDGGRPDPDKSDPAFVMEGELKNVGGIKVRGSQKIIYLAVLAFMLLLSVPLWAVSDVGGPAVTGLIALLGVFFSFKKII